MSNRNKEIRDAKSASRTLSAVIIGLLLLGLIIAGSAAFFYFSASQKPLDPNNKKTTKVEVLPGETATMIGEKLEKKNIIKSSDMFKYYLKFNNISNFQAGSYELSPSMTFKQISKSLQEGKVYQPIVFKMNIPEGITIDEIAAIVAKNTSIKAGDFMKEVNSRDFVKKMQKKHPKLISNDVFAPNIKRPLEGYLYPATYEFTKKNPSTEEIVDKMLTATQDNAFPLWNKYGGIVINEGGTEKHLTFHEFLTFSSLVEREATGLTDRAKIASVFINRMEQNPPMPLQTDPTVLYALGRHKEVTYEADLKVNSPYNTYINTGLPPGPIATSGTASMESVLNPAHTDYLYFLADSSGKNYFSKTLEEHNKLKAEHIDNQ
ncbi:endolytic transglycosylase MltG [Macrococcus equipercicus]|uniref:Endolytic murein transglycosylase n=1 Tax=Macrococcus equipercicus TaxID=69967 RepID=A0A9Q9F0J6_9STAP|nr:endolytic transglycosylase MltG [Macrococcus equipercicus]KAA1040035.1 endolytic transglycosylase MltG [Macrococcus equipercicus]UTH13033.1 endolytic transglycosylase MltG [Macrococcus equipercicus]